MNKVNIIICFIYYCIFSSGLLNAQEIVYNTFIQDSIGVGENVDFYISVEQQNTPNVSSINLNAIENILFYPAVPSQGDTIKSTKADIAVNSYGLWIDADKNGIIEGEELKWEKVQNGDTIIYRNKLNFSFFDVGIYVFEGFLIENNGTSITTNKAYLKVNFKDYDQIAKDSSGLAPIKGIVNENLAFLDILPFLLMVVIPILLIFAVIKFVKYRKSHKLIPEPIQAEIIPPDVKALNELRMLKTKELWQKGEIKTYQSELSYIIREYLEGRYDIKALENTTSQIINSIQDTTFDEEDQIKLKRILQISDLVKFAKAQPNVNVHEEFMNDAISFVEKTKQELTQENREEE